MNTEDYLQQLNGAEIAIIGMSGRFPGSESVDELWINLINGKECISYFTAEELIANGLPRRLAYDPKWVKASAVFKDYDKFDASFFGITPNEAVILDPQQRIFLEVCWQALEDAGYNPLNTNHTVGIFAGCSIPNYLLTNLYNEFKDKAEFFLNLALSNANDYLTTRASYKLNLTGPSHVVQSACSTSLLAVHNACQSILNGECDMALAGGISFQSLHGYLHIENSLFSSDGKCRVFDESADGTIFGSGVGLVVLKRLRDAVNDGDHIEAIILGSAINNDGNLKVGYTAPSLIGQANVISEALGVSDVLPEDIRYIEAHGTGTELGDPIEIHALTKVFSAYTSQSGYCGIGSVKTNLGHLEAAAGITGLIKSILIAKHKIIPPSLHYNKPNPKANLENSPFYVCNKLEKIDNHTKPIIVGVSAFGVGGTNAHVIIKEPPLIDRQVAPNTYLLIPLSAKNQHSLTEIKNNLIKYLNDNPDINLNDLSYTLQVGRQSFQYRGYHICKDKQDLLHSLLINDNFKLTSNIQNICFMFSGQGSLSPNTSKILFQHLTVFRESMQDCAIIFEQEINIDIIKILYENENERIDLNDTKYAQALIFSIEYSLAKFWLSLGVHPTILIGHSLGEYVAACISGIFTLKDAIKIISIRSKLMDTIEKGAMISVNLSFDKVKKVIGELNIDIAVHNAKDLFVLSGAYDEINLLSSRLKQNNVAIQPLNTSHAFHSRQMESILDNFYAQIEDIKFNIPSIPIFSNVTGELAQESIANAKYWVEHIRKTVLFYDGICHILHSMKPAETLMIDIGPNDTLSKLVNLNNDIEKPHIVSTITTKSDDEFNHLYSSIGKIWSIGININFDKLHDKKLVRRISAPVYSFKKDKYWLNPRQGNESYVSDSNIQEYSNIQDWLYTETWIRYQVRQISQPELKCQNENWLIFHDGSIKCDKLIKLLKRSNQTVIQIIWGNNYHLTNEHAFVINPHEIEHYHQLFEQLLKIGIVAKNILIFTFCKNQSDLLNYESVKHSSELSFYSLLNIAKVKSKLNITEHYNITCITSSFYSVLGTEDINPQLALVLGPAKVIPLESNSISVKILDLLIQNLDDSKAISDIISYHKANNVPEIVASRGEYLWRQSFERFHIDNAKKVKAVFRRNGVYIITGGLGGIGFHILNYLASKTNGTLIVIQRTKLPNKDQWDKMQNNPKVNETIEKIRAIEKHGVDIIVESGDISLESDVSKIIKRIKSKYKKISGVIHAAGNPSGGIHVLKDRDSIEHVFGPKIYGTLNLYNQLQSEPLDFFINFSSRISHDSVFGQIDYTSANAFLNSLSYYKKPSLWKRNITIVWNMWKNTGMSENNSDVISGLSNADYHFKDVLQNIETDLTTREGIELFDKIVHQQIKNQIIICSVDYNRLRENGKLLIEKLKTTSELEKTPQSSKLINERPPLPNEYVSPLTSTEISLTEILQNLLGINKVGITDNFFELGGHSLIAIQFMSKVREKFKVEISISALLENPIIKIVAEQLDRELEKSKAPQDLHEGIISQLQSLSDEEVRKIIDEKQQQNS